MWGLENLRVITRAWQKYLDGVHSVVDWERTTSGVGGFVIGPDLAP